VGRVSGNRAGFNEPDRQQAAISHHGRSMRMPYFWLLPKAGVVVQPYSLIPASS